MCEALQTLGIISSKETNMDKHLERLLNTTTKWYKDLLLILNDLTCLIRIKQNLTNNGPSPPSISTTSSSNQNNLLFLLDDFITFDFNNGTCSNQSTDSNNIDDALTKKMQILDDENFYREFKNLSITSTYSSNSLIPNDFIRLVKTINENSKYLSTDSSNSSSKEYFKLIQDRLNAIKDEIEEKKTCLYSVFILFIIKFNFLIYSFLI